MSRVDHKCMLPCPVYVATLDDGRRIRMSVWQSSNAPAKGYDWEACRRTVLCTSDHSLPAIPTYCAGSMFQMPPMLSEAGRRIVSAHLEQADMMLAADPLTVIALKKPRANNMAVRAALEAFMAGKAEARHMAEMALAA